MSFCENCGSQIPEGERLCRNCLLQQAMRGAPGAAGQSPEAERAAPPDREERERRQDAPDAQPHKQAGQAAAFAPASSARGRGLAIALGALLAAFLLFFAAALVFGGDRAGKEDGTASGLEAWQGAGEETTSADPGPDSLQLTAPDAQQVLENTPPDPLEGHSYQIVVEDATWQEAYDRAAAAGGHLATITSQEEYDTICALADQAMAETGVRYLWLGARRGSGGWTGSDCWITGEEWSFQLWYPGEPSGQDTDGTVEDVLCLWNVENSGWTFNDQRNDLISVLPTVSGSVGYVIEFEG